MNIEELQRAIVASNELRVAAMAANSSDDLCVKLVRSSVEPARQVRPALQLVLYRSSTYSRLTP